MGKALDDLLMAAADLDVKEMRELSKGCLNRIPATMHLSIMDVLLALNVWGEDRQKQAALDIPPKPPGNDATYVAAFPPTPPQANVARRSISTTFGGPTLDDVRYLVGAQLPSLVRIMQLRKLLGMGAEPSLDGDVARDIVQGRWVGRSTPLSTRQLQDILDDTAEALGTAKKD